MHQKQRAILHTFAVALASIVAVAIGLRLARYAPRTVREVSGGGVFLLVLWALGFQCRVPTWQQLLRGSSSIASGSTLFSMVVLTNANLRAFPVGTLITVFLLSLMEEIVYRRLLPDWFDQLLTHEFPKGITLPAAVVVAQLSFSAGHFVAARWSMFRLDLSDAFVLFLSGLLYWLIVDSAGLGLAVAVHGGLNLVAMSPGEHWQTPSPPVLAGATLAVGLLLRTRMLSRSKGAVASVVQP
ncbi:MAG: CPBP family intramembrane metalloprotease [Gemmatimonadaceae bacterium]|nr:CPBP family intramembrane metalloprotease [Gemmatimonadaceae bacterium]